MDKKSSLEKGRPVFPYPTKLPHAVLFDWDNTLVDTWRVSYESFNTALRAIGRETITVEQFWTNPHRSVRDSEGLFGEHQEKGEKIFYDEVIKRHLNELMPLEGAQALLENLRDRGLYVGVVSNKNGGLLRKEVAHLGWSDHFRHVVGSYDVEQDKPSPLPVFEALRPGSLHPEEHDVWFVGDSIVDVHCARAAGCIPMVVGQGGASLEDDVIHVKTCEGLMQLIENL